jgi:adenosylmethionine-8-amino-7-oxononanoate aminotransferase
MSDPTTSGPSEEELRAYLESLRAAQPVEILVQSFGILATASEVKLGQPDARVLIDGMAALLEATAEHMPPEIVTRMRETVAQLQLAQVQAERDAASGPSDAAQQAASAQPDGPAGEATRESPASKLWIPGRD